MFGGNDGSVGEICVFELHLPEEYSSAIHGPFPARSARIGYVGDTRRQLNRVRPGLSSKGDSLRPGIARNPSRRPSVDLVMSKDTFAAEDFESSVSRRLSSPADRLGNRACVRALSDRRS